MTTEQDKTLAGLKTAIQMEIDGREYYLKASRESSNETGKKLLQSLADEEDSHRQRFAEIYESVRTRNAWSKTAFQPDGGKGLRTILAKGLEEMERGEKTATTELDAVKTAMDMENKTYDFYKEQGKNAAYDIEGAFYQALATQEREHYLVLLDYYEYLKDPAAWFVKTEHPTLDGG